MTNGNKVIAMPYQNNCTDIKLQKTPAGIRTIHWIGFLVVAALLAHWPVFTHEFQMKWDDWWVVMNEYTEAGFSWDNVTAIFTEFYHGQYAPVNELFYLTLYTMFEYDSFWFHTASLVIHIGCVLLVFSLIKRVLKKGGDFSRSSVTHISFITALLMALHPFLVEAVAWMSASKCMLFTLFYLLALHSYMSWLSRKKVIYLVLTLLCYALSFGGKEQAVTLPLCLLLFDYIFKRNFRNSYLWMEKLPFMALTTGFILVTFFSQKLNGEGVLSGQQLHPWYQNIVFATYCTTEYFIKCLFPIRLSYLYPFPNLPGEPMPLHLWIYPLLFVFVAVGFWKFWKQRWIAFGTGFFLIQASVISNIIPTSRYAIIADRYVYLAAVGVFFLVAYWIDRLLLQQLKRKYTILYLAMMYILCMGIYTNQRTRVWHDSFTLKKEMQEVLQSRKDYKNWKEQYDRRQQGKYK